MINRTQIRLETDDKQNLEKKVKGKSNRFLFWVNINLLNNPEMISRMYKKGRLKLPKIPEQILSRCVFLIYIDFVFH